MKSIHEANCFQGAEEAREGRYLQCEVILLPVQDGPYNIKYKMV